MLRPQNKNTDQLENEEFPYYEILNTKPNLYDWTLSQLFNYDGTAPNQKLKLDETDEILVDPQVYPSKILADSKTAQKLQKAYSFCFYEKPLKTHISGNTATTQVLKSAYKDYVEKTHNKGFKEGDYVSLKVNGRQFKILKCYEGKNQYLLEQISNTDSRSHIITQAQDIQHYNYK